MRKRVTLQRLGRSCKMPGKQKRCARSRSGHNWNERGICTRCSFSLRRSIKFDYLGWIQPTANLWDTI